MQGKARFIFPFFLSGIMAFLMTGFVTWLNLGFPADFLKRWMVAWWIAWPLAYLSALIAAPFAQRATKFVISKAFSSEVDSGSREENAAKQGSKLEGPSA